MEAKRNDHDQNFKNLITDYPREALEFFAPSEAKSIPSDAIITPIREQLPKERLGDRFYEMDVPIEVRFPNNEREIIVFCVEENSNGHTTDLRRHAIYALQLSQARNTTRVVPVAIHPFDKIPAEETFELTGDHGTYLQFKVLTTTLPTIKASEHLDSRNRVELVCLPLMNCEDDQRVAILKRSCDGFYENESDLDKLMKYLPLIYRNANFTLNDLKSTIAEIVRTGSSRKKEVFMSVYDQIKEEGKAESTIKTVMSFLHSNLISIKQAREQLEKFAAAGEIPEDKLREALAQISKN